MAKSKLKDVLYNYYSEHTRLFNCSMIIFLVLVVGSIFRDYLCVFSDQNLSYYLFSTVVQGFLALVGVLGAVALFKIQLLESNATSTTEFVKAFVTAHRGVLANGYSPEEMMVETEKILEDQQITLYRSNIEVAYNKLKKISVEKSEIRKDMVDFSLWSFFDVLLALIGMPFSKFLIVHQLYFWIGLYSIFNILLSLVALLLAFIMIRHILGYSFTRKL